MTTGVDRASTNLPIPHKVQSFAKIERRIMRLALEKEKRLTTFDRCNPKAN